MVGRQWEGCAATIGAMPRCAFDCTSCYLPRDANRAKPLPLEALFAQLERIRRHFGPWGNVQITDGEVTLRDADELVALLKHAAELQLIPMVMTHGETFLRDPALLRRLVIEGGLREVSFHVDTTQRGGRGLRAHRVERERELDPVRDACANLVRELRRETGIELRVAATVTVESHNLDQLDEIVRWTLANSDVMRILSFQPSAQVGRTRPDGVKGVDELWRVVERGLGREVGTGILWFGPRECSRVEMGCVWKANGAPPRFAPWRDVEDEASEAFALDALQRWGGLSFRADTRSIAAARALGLVAGAPWIALRSLGYLRRWLRRRLDISIAGAGLSLLRRRAALRPLAIVSHHFMDAHELETPLGAERCDACVFRVPIDGELVSMCRVNAGQDRERLYGVPRQAPPVTQHARTS